MTEQTRVEFRPLAAPGRTDPDASSAGAENLTDEQWLAIIAATSVGAVEPYYSLPQRPGDPVRLLFGVDAENVLRCDADGTRLLEPWTPA